MKLSGTASRRPQQVHFFECTENENIETLTKWVESFGDKISKNDFNGYYLNYTEIYIQFDGRFIIRTFNHVYFEMGKEHFHNTYDIQSVDKS